MKLLVLNAGEFSYSYGGVCYSKRSMDEDLQETFDVEYIMIPQSVSKLFKWEKEYEIKNERMV